MLRLMRFLQALARPFEGLQYTGTIKRLEQIVDGIHVEGTHGILIKSRSKNDLRHAIGVLLLEQLLEHSKAIQSRHLNVQKDYIRMVSANQMNGLDAILALGDDLNPSR